MRVSQVHAAAAVIALTALVCVVAGHAVGQRAFARIDAARYEPLLLAIVVAAGAASVVAGVITAST